VRLKEELAAPLRVLQETARRIAKVSNESGIALVEDEYVQSFKVEMMDAVLQWCKGAKFADICKVRRVASRGDILASAWSTSNQIELVLMVLALS
jgi:ATP-dependent RNA helicase DOB1